MSTCIRDCNQRFISAQCASEVTCACADTGVLHKIYACVQSTCAAEVSRLTSSVGNACGANVAAAMAVSPSASAGTSASPVGTSPAASTPVTASQLSAETVSSAAVQTPSSAGPAEAATPATSATAGTDQQLNGPSSAAAAQPQWTSSARSEVVGASQDWLGGADSGSASAPARTSASDNGSRAGASSFAASSSRFQQVPLSSSSVPRASTALQPTSGLGTPGREKASDGSAADSSHPGTSGSKDEQGTPSLPSIVGGVLGALAAIALLAYLVWRYWFKSGRSSLRRNINGRGREGRSRILSVVSDPGTGKGGPHMAPTRGEWEKFGSSLGSPVPRTGTLSGTETSEKVPMDDFDGSLSPSSPRPHGQARHRFNPDGQLGTPVQASYLSFMSTGGLASPPVSAGSSYGAFCAVPRPRSPIMQEPSSTSPVQPPSSSRRAEPELETVPARRGLFSHHFESHAPVPPPSMRSKRTSAAVTFASDSSHAPAHRNHGRPDVSPFGDDDYDSDGGDADTIETGIHTLDSQTHLARAYYTAAGERRPVSSTFSLGTIATGTGPFSRTAQEHEADAERRGAYEDLSRGNSLHAPSSRSPVTSAPSSRNPSRAPSTRSRLAHSSLNQGKSKSARSSDSYAAARRRQSLGLPSSLPSNGDRVPEQGASMPPSVAESLAPTPSLSRTSTVTDISLGAVGRRSCIMGRAM